MNDKFVFKENRKTMSVRCAEIVFFESYGHYITIHMNDGNTYSARCTMASLVEKMDKKTFVRVHRGVMVNLGYVRAIHRTGVLLNSIWEKVPVSRSCREAAEKAFNEFNNRVG